MGSGFCAVDGAIERIGGREPPEAIDVVPGHGVIVRGVGVALVGSEEELVIGGVVPWFAVGKMPHLGKGVAARVGDEAVGETVLMVILGAGGVGLRDECGTGVNVFAGRCGDRGGIGVFGDDLAAGEDVHSGDAAAGNFLHAQAVSIVPGMIVLVRWLPGESLGMRIHGSKVEGAKVSAPGTGAGDLPVSDAVRGESLVGRPIILMG